jgi:hypothetical protein
MTGFAGHTCNQFHRTGDIYRLLVGKPHEKLGLIFLFTFAKIFIKEAFLVTMFDGRMMRLEVEIMQANVLLGNANTHIGDLLSFLLFTYFNSETTFKDSE